MENLYCDHFKLTFDFANFIQCNENTMYAFDILKKYITYIHIKDAKLSTGEVVPAGEGDGKISEILGLLNTENYTGFLSLEPHLHIFDGLQRLEQEQVSIKALNETTNGEAAYIIASNALKKILN